MSTLSGGRTALEGHRVIHPSMPVAVARAVTSERVPARAGARGGALVRTQILGLGAGTAALVMMLWGLGRPAFWMDEAASQVATQRSWSHVWLMLQGTDAPLVPYYLLLKAQKAVAMHFWPAVAAHPEALLRWPSALAVAVAAWVLASWLRVAASDWVAAGSVSVLLLIEGVSRYGQEARPYALVMMMAIVATAVWWRLMRTSSPAVAVAYAACVALLVCLHALAASVVLAHLVAMVLIRREELFLRSLAGVCGAGTGLLVTCRLTIDAMVQGSGASHYAPLTATTLLRTFLSLFEGTLRPDPRVLIVMGLALVGLTRWNSPRYADVARVATAWALVPALALIPAIALQPNLLKARYVLFVIPGWAILAGLGVATVAETWGRVAALNRATAVLTTAAVSLGLVSVLAFAQWPTLSAIRTPAGHGESVRPVLAQLQSPLYRSLPIAVTSQFAAIELGAYAPEDAARMLNVRYQTDLVDIWPEPVPRPLLKQTLRAVPTLVLLARTGGCAQLPGYLGRYEVTRAVPAPGRWSLYLLRRKPPPAPGAISSAAASQLLPPCSAVSPP